MTLPTAAATPASSAPASANLTVQDILDHLPDDVVAGALIRRDGVRATAGPVTAEAYARIGSVTKAFTNTVVLQLVAEHRIGLDTPARRYVPQVLPEAYNRVTVRQLLDHTSGLQSPYPWAEGGISPPPPTWTASSPHCSSSLLPPAQQGLVFEVPNLKSAADNTNCVGQAACYSIGGLLRYQLPSGEYTWGKTGSRPGWDNGFFATRDLRHRVVYSPNPRGTGNDLPYIKAIVNAGLAG
ncbi:serine hydrolase domain-containing protein [Streptomyces sp. NRRL S-1022]|uniref:serine hydrolase domain-containing protein n=1 Tax=Streptomyces sp. NRRL S-1022 TaxID=1463880 RepID=UPI000A5B935D|nr:serine hydrolase domain-containing protein [Streptomyces sp. NRRL S-1022]